MRMKNLLKKAAAFVMIAVFAAGTVCAEENDIMWIDKNFTVVQNQAYWIGEGTFKDAENITRAETAALVVKILGIVYPSGNSSYRDVNDSTPYASKIYAAGGLNIFTGSDGFFYPDRLITREELAVALVRAYNVIKPLNAQSEIDESKLTDYDEISPWAVQSVYDAMGIKALSAKNKKFSPKSYVTRSQAVEAILKIADTAMFEYTKTQIQTADNTENTQQNTAGESVFGEVVTSVSGDNVLKGRDFGKTETIDAKTVSESSVYQKVVIENQMGTSGAYMKARYSAGDTVELLFSRTTQIPEKEASFPYAPATYIRVEDPDGNLVGFYDFSEQESGITAVRITPSVKKDGIWTFRFVGGRTGDTIEFGCNTTSSWGIAGMSAFVVTEKTLKEGWIYIPRTVNEFHVVSNNIGNISVYDDSGKSAGTFEGLNSGWYKYILRVTDAKPESTYKIQFSSSCRDRVAIDIAPSLICPTKEMALDLKGGWIEADNGILCQGPLQARAMNLAVDIATNRNINFEVPEIPALPEKIEYPMAEAQLFGKYAPISGLEYAMKTQILDTDNPYLGYVNNNDAIKADYQTGNFCGINLSPLDGMSAALRTPSKLNYYYGNEVLANRLELYLISCLTSLSEDMFVRENRLESGTTGVTHGGFWLKYNTHAFQLLKNWISKEDLEIIEEAMIAMEDSQQNYRGYVTNQLQHATESLLCMYIATGIERYHDSWKRQINTVITPVSGWEHFGFKHDQGYFVEAMGCDGNYSWLNDYFFNNMYREYRELETADPEICEKMAQIIDEYLEFESFFWLTDPIGLDIGEFPMPSNFTSRTNSTFGFTNGYPHIERVMDIHPLAKRRQEMIGYKHKDSTFPSSVFPHLLNDEEWAVQHINELYPKYSAQVDGITGGWTNDLYNVFYNAYYGEGKDVVAAETLPCEDEDQVWSDRPGFIAFKNKGIYGYCFYEFNLNWSVPAPSYLGGGPTALWGENTGGTLIGKKHTDYNNVANVNSAEKINAACIYGTDSTGKFILSGKEHSYIKWIEENKIWEIYGTIPNTSQTVTWRYEMTDTGIRITASLSDTKGGNYWVNLPLYSNSAGTALDILSYKEGELKIGKGTEAMTYKWEGTKSQLADPSNAGVRNLHIQIPKSGSISIDISCR